MAGPPRPGSAELAGEAVGGGRRGCPAGSAGRTRPGPAPGTRHPPPGAVAPDAPRSAGGDFAQPTAYFVAELAVFLAAVFFAAVAFAVFVPEAAVFFAGVFFAAAFLAVFFAGPFARFSASSS